ncbi:MAG: C-terminal binding protein [Thermomicrobiales bacterium]
MQATDVLARWRQPDRWRKPGRVALANAASVDPEEPLNATLLAAGADVVAAPLREQDGSVNATIAGSDVVITGGARLQDEFFAALNDTRLIVRPYVGYDDIDVDAATAHGILVANIPDAIAEDVANQALALILSANREIVRLDHFVRTGDWARLRQRTPDGMIIHRPSVLTLGLVGFGNIGQATARRARAFGYRLIAHDPYIAASVAEEQGVTLVGFDDLLREADVVSVHTFLNDQTRHLINAEKLALMKPTAWIINTARGPIIDEEALIAALKNGTIAGAGLDVMEVEPLDPASPLIQLDNVILSPHVAGYSEEGSRLMRTRAAEIAWQVASGGLPQRHVVINKALYDELAALPELASVSRA